MIHVELHRHGLSSPIQVSSNYITQVSLASSVAPPHGQANLSLKVPLNSFSLIQNGDWLVIRNSAGIAEFFGKVVSVNDSIAVSSSVVISTYDVSAISWLDALNDSEVFAPEGALTQDVGTLFTKESWSGRVAAILKNFTFGAIGQALQTFFTSIARVNLPSSLGAPDLMLGDTIPIVYNQAVATALGITELAVEELPTAGALPTQISFWTVKSRAYDLIRGLFLPDPRLIEMFPYFAPASKGTSSPLGAALGVTPCIIYRIRPWRETPLANSVFASVTGAPLPPASSVQVAPPPPPKPPVPGEFELIFRPDRSTAADAPTPYFTPDPPEPTTPVDAGSKADARTALLLGSQFNAVTWSRPTFVKVPEELVTSITRSRNDSDRVNCSTVNLVISQIEALNQSGLPVRSDREILNHGLRSVQATWPFIVRPEQSAQLVDFITYMRSIAVQIMQFYHQGHLLGTGAVQCAIAAKAGSKNLIEAVPGRPFYIHLSKAGTTFTAYAESVSKTFSLSQGAAVTGKTEIHYSRGLYENEESFRTAMVPMPTQEVAAAVAAASVTGPPLPVGLPNLTSSSPAPAATETVASSANDDPKASCMDGRQVGQKWPVDSPDNLVIPDWLKEWVLKKTRDRVIPQILDGKQRAGKQDSKNIAVTAAAAYVIYRFWRIKDPNADIKITSWTNERDSKTHKTCGAIDFEISLPSTKSKVPALQAWLSLSVLAEAGRIPFGGRGLYLNVNPETGIKGVRAEEAGTSSSSTGGPGGSSSTHYDARGTFGIKSSLERTNTVQGTTWVGMDWTGDGADELTIGRSPNKDGTGEKPSVDQVFAVIADPGGLLKKGSSPAGHFKLKSMFNDGTSPRKDWSGESDPARVALRDAVRNFFFDKPKDPFLPEVSSGVPNILQVLGYESWCGNGPVAAITPVPSPPPQEGNLRESKHGRLSLVDSKTAPLIVVYGGIDKGTTPSGKYMYDYVGLLQGKNHVFVASSNRVDSLESYKWLMDQIKSAGKTPRSVVLYLYSGGQRSGALIGGAQSPPFSAFNKVYLVDIYLSTNSSNLPLWVGKTDEEKGFLGNYPSKFVFLHTSSGTAWSSKTKKKILGDPIGGYQQLGLEVVFIKTDHYKINKSAVEHLLKSGLVDV